MFDCGIHPGLQGANSLPFLTNEDLDDVNVALITHFHLDHCAAVPFLLSHTTFKASMVLLSCRHGVVVLQAAEMSPHHPSAAHALPVALVAAPTAAAVPVIPP
jgi:predicted metal-dependent RNase